MSKKGSCGNNPGDCNYTLYTDGHLEITGNGAMKDYGQYGSPFKGNQAIQSISIGDGITSIGAWSIQGTGLKSISIPNSVTSIGNWSLNGLQEIEHLVIPDSVTTIGEYSFSDMQNLKSIVLSE